MSYQDDKIDALQNAFLVLLEAFSELLSEHTNMVAAVAVTNRMVVQKNDIPKDVMMAAYDQERQKLQGRMDDIRDRISALRNSLSDPGSSRKPN